MHNSRFSRLAIGLATVLALVVGLWVSLPTTYAAPEGGNNSAQILVAFGGGNTVVKTVTFTESSISGLEALERAFTLETAEGAVCSIENTGCPSTDCFCAFPAYYWQYLHRDNGAWLYSEVGPADYQIGNGAVEAWVWDGALPPTSDPIFAAQAALEWMRPQQLANGSYNNNVGGTIEAIWAVAATNADPAEWALTSDDASLTEYLTEQGLSYATNVGRTGKLALGVAAAGLDPRDFVGADLVLSLTQYYSPTTGVFGPSNWDQSLAMLGWRAAGETIPITATQALADRINSDGGWGFAAGSDSDVDSTALVLQALVAGGEPITSTLVISGVAYLDSTQEANGGLPYVAGSGSNTNSTGYGVQGIIAAGSDPLTVPFTISGTNPITYLLDMQTISGGFAYTDVVGGPNLLATVQVLPGLTGKPFPYLSNAVAQRNAVEWVLTQHQEDGSFAGFNPGATLDAVMALKASGVDLATVESPTGNSPLDYLTAQAETYATSAAAAGKLILGVQAAGGNPRDLDGFDAVATLTEFYSPTTGSFGANTFAQAWGILGYVASGTDVPDAAIAFAKESASEEGGWGFDLNAAAPDADSTALMLQALAAAGVPKTDADVLAAIAWLHDAQNSDGGFPGFDTLTSPSTTGLVLQAFAAYGEDGDSLDWTTLVDDGSTTALTWQTPSDRILTFQSPEGGFSGYSGPNDAYSTYQALIGIASVPYGEVSPPAPGTPILYLPLMFDTYANE